jgi:molybdenum cofactor cytidylyltransferase
MSDRSICGVLLAAGRATRFGGDKLLAALPNAGDGAVPVGVAAYRALRAAISRTLVVVRPDDDALRGVFAQEGARVVVAHRADEGIGASLAAGVAAVTHPSAYVIALADMPWIESATISRVVQALANGASVVAPVYRGERGHPVGFASGHRAALLKLRGDEGARALLAAHREALTLIDVDDPGILRDIDTPDDLRRL